MFTIFKRQVSNNSIHDFLQWFKEEKLTNERFNSVYKIIDHPRLKVIVSDSEVTDEQLLEEIENKIEMKFEMNIIEMT